MWPAVLKPGSDYAQHVTASRARTLKLIECNPQAQLDPLLLANRSAGDFSFAGVPNRWKPTIRRPGAICSSVAMAEALGHRMAIARDQHGGAEFYALCLFGDAGESDPYIMAEGGNLGAPDRAKAEVFC
jgi:hypothetical protein